MADGAPNLAPGEGGGHVTDLQLAISDSPSVGSVTVNQGYAIFLRGVQVLVADSFISYEYQNDSKLPQYQQQSGAFATYNKVATPFDVRVVMTKTGEVADRTAFLIEIEAAAQSLNLYDVVTPEKTYSSVNIVKIAHRHTERNGATMMTVEIWFLEVRATAAAQFTQSSPPLTDTASASGADPKNVGVVQPAEVPPAQQEVVNLALQMQALQTSADHAAATHH